jgi:feruloyl esterase
VPPTKYAAIHRAVLDACDALDGVKDGLISNPPQCHFDPAVLTCRGEDNSACLTPRQVETVRRLMSPLRDPTDGAELFPGWEPGNELAWGAVIAGPEPNSLMLDHYRYVVFKNPAWEWKTFDVHRDISLAQKADDGTVDVGSPDVRRFLRRGGKLLLYHGWSDMLVPPRASVNKFEHIIETMSDPSKTSQSVRLFMVPGMGHCSGGEGPSEFDKVGPLEQWVEQGRAPERIVASHLKNGQVDRTRPLCPYPQLARYTGTGNTDDAANFVCKDQ